MKKLLAALMVSGLFSGAVMAQTHVQLYGIADTGIIKESGSDARMGSNMSSRIGVMGSEDLGGGMKATFDLLQRFNMNNGTLTGNYSWNEKLVKNLGDDKKTEWTGYANVGLAGSWGQVRLGRVGDLIGETFTMIDPFDQNGIASSFSFTNLLHSHFLSNSVRYDSPVFSGMNFAATYTLSGNSKGDSALSQYMQENGNDGFALNVKYDSGPLLLLANFERAPDSNKSFLWDVGGTYAIGNFKFFLGYEQSTFKSLGNYDVPRANQKEWLTGLQYRNGQHLFIASYDRGAISGTAHDGHANKYALGYGYDFSKRTQLYTNLIYIDSSNADVGSFYNTNGTARDSMSGVQVGITHKF